MTSAHSRRAARAFVLMGAFAALALGVTVPGAPRPAAAAQKEKDVKPAGPMPTDPIRLSGTFECKVCHSLDKETAKTTYEGGTNGHEFIRLGENRVWSVYDLHSQALENIKPGKNETAKRMEENLKKYNGPEYTTVKDVNCLACHASVKQPINTDPEGKERPGTVLPSKWTDKSFAVNEGVGCEMCHGHGNAYLNKHKSSEPIENPVANGPTLSVPWREWDPHLKEAWGLVDLRDPARMVKQCASCHVGSVAEGRFVTHEMFAAGHPPLPPFDALAYTREQPRHWGIPREMPYLKKLADTDPAKAWKVFHARKEDTQDAAMKGGKEDRELYNARRMAVSAIATLRESAALIGQGAAHAQKEQDGLDFAAFDCYACHHDLKVPSDRQQRGFVGRPGRVLIRPSAFALARVVVQHGASTEKGKGGKLVGADKALDEAELELASAFKKKSLGDNAVLKASSDKLVKWSNDMIAELDAVRYTRAESVRLAQALAKAASGPVGDPETAQVLMWGVETLRFDLRDTSPDGKTEPTAVAQMLGKLDGVVVTRLRTNLPFLPGEPANVPDPEKDPMAAAKLKAEFLKPVSDRVGPRLKTFNNFSAPAYRDIFGKLAPAFGEFK